MARHSLEGTHSTVAGRALRDVRITLVVHRAPAVRQLNQLRVRTAPDPIRVRMREAEDDIDLVLGSEAIRSFAEPLGRKLQPRERPVR